MIQTQLIVAGVDEAGRGPLAGPVMAAAVILHPERPIAGLADSKLLSPRRRDALAAQIRAQAWAFAVAAASVEEIDRLNILQASLLAMQRAVAALALPPHAIIVDGNRCPMFAVPCRAIVKGDQTEPAISAASILAKVQRDSLMVELDAQFPGYGFAKHKGYPSKDHVERLRALGPTPHHRVSFGPVRDAIAG